MLKFKFFCTFFGLLMVYGSASAENCHAVGQCGVLGSSIVIAYHKIHGDDYNKRIAGMSYDRLVGEEGRIRNNLCVGFCCMLAFGLLLFSIFCIFLYQSGNVRDFTGIGEDFLNKMRCKMFWGKSVEYLPKRIRRFVTDKGEVMILPLAGGIFSLLLLSFCIDLVHLNKVRHLKSVRAAEEARMERNVEEFKHIDLQELLRKREEDYAAMTNGTYWKRLLMENTNAYWKQLLKTDADNFDAENLKRQSGTCEER